jgi:hypothetical protein
MAAIAAGISMSEKIEEGFVVFIADGAEGVGAVEQVGATSITVYVENAGEFEVPRSAIKDVHSQKVILDPKRLDRGFLDAIGHQHDREDPNLVG